MALTKEQFAKLEAQLTAQKAKTGGSSSPSVFSSKPGIIESFKNSLTSSLSQIGQKRGSALESIADANASGEQGVVRSGFQATGNVLGGAAQALGAVGKAAFETLPDSLENKIKSAVGTVAKGAITAAKVPLGSSGAFDRVVSKVQEIDADIKELEKTDPARARDLKAAFGLGEFALAASGVSQGVKTASNIATQGVRAGSAALSAVDNAASAATAGITDTLAPVGGTIRNIAKGSKQTIENIGQGIARIPERAAINAASTEARAKEIASFKSPTISNAIADGVEVQDIKSVSKLTKPEKAATAKIFDYSKKFEADKSVDKYNPKKLVGDTAAKRYEGLITLQKDFGSQLGDVAKNLPKIGTKQSLNPVMNKLKSTPGFEGIDLNPDGTLNFSNTVLKTNLSQSEKEYIQTVFDEAIKNETGYQKHLTRQAIFEDLGGKTRAGIKLTASEAKAAEAIRAGIGDAIGDVAPKYKTLSAKYREVIEPLKELKKRIDPNDELTDEQFLVAAGNYARRLTSNSKTGPEFASILEMTDEILKKNGIKVPVSTRKMQEMLNLMTKYMDIAEGSSLQGVIESAGEKLLPTSKTEVLARIAQKATGKTEDVRRAAFEKAMKELLGL